MKTHKQRTCTSIEEMMLHVADHCQQQSEKKPVLYIPGNAGRIAAVEQYLFDNAEALGSAFLFQILSFGAESGWRRLVDADITPVTPFIGPGHRALVNEGAALNIRAHLSQVHQLYTHQWRPDVAIAHVSAPDTLGRVTLGLNAGLDISAVKAAKYRVAVINTQLPRFHIETVTDAYTGRQTETGCAMYLHDFDMLVAHDEPLLEHRADPAKGTPAVTNIIAERIINTLQEDTSHAKALPHTFQLGIGAIPDAVAQYIASQHISINGIWSEMFSNGVLDLYQKGLIQNTGGRNLRDRIVVGFVLGDTTLYKTMHENPSFAVIPQEIANDPALIRLNPHMVSINTALAVSVTGEVVAASVGPKYYSGVGGQKDFAEGASLAEGGRAFIALASRTTPRHGEPQSKIVALHDAGTHHTISADLPVTVVTEHGIADLRYVPDTQRVQRMVHVADPSEQLLLAQQARMLPSLQRVKVMEPASIQLTNGTIATLRTSTIDDVPKMVTYIQGLSPEDIRTRFLTPSKYDFLTNPARLHDRYIRTIDVNRRHVAFVVEQNHSVIGVAHAFETRRTGVYDISFSRRSDMEGIGIGDQLMHALVQWAHMVGAHTFEADVVNYNSNMRSLFRRWKFSCKQNPDEPTLVLCTATPATIEYPAQFSKTA